MQAKLRCATNILKNALHETEMTLLDRAYEGTLVARHR
jgi:hypothetical protein